MLFSNDHSFQKDSILIIFFLQILLHLSVQTAWL
jgi:hypothetical protein